MLCTRLNNCHWMFTFFLSRTVNRSIPLFLKLPKTGSTICHPFVVNKPATQRVEFALHPYSHAQMWSWQHWSHARRATEPFSTLPPEVPCQFVSNPVLFTQ
jgi:hypothetical protein